MLDAFHLNNENNKDKNAHNNNDDGNGDYNNNNNHDNDGNPNDNGNNGNKADANHISPMKEFDEKIQKPKKLLKSSNMFNDHFANDDD